MATVEDIIAAKIAQLSTAHYGGQAAQKRARSNLPAIDVMDTPEKVLKNVRRDINIKGFDKEPAPKKAPAKTKEVKEKEAEVSAKTKLETQMAEQKAKIAAAPKKPGKEHWWESIYNNPVTDFVGEEVIGGGKEVLGHALDYADRPRNAVFGALTNLLHAPRDAAGLNKRNVGTGIVQGLTREKEFHGTDVIGWHPGGVAEGIAQFGTDVALDPTTYVSFGTTSLGKAAAQKLLAKGLSPGTAKTVISVAKAAGKNVTARSVARSTVKRTPAEVATIVAREGEQFRNLKKVQVAAKAETSRIVRDRIKQGVSVSGPEKILIHQQQEEILTRAAREQLNDVLSAADKRRFQFKVLGKDIGDRSKVAAKILETSYKGVNAPLKAMSHTTIGRVLGEAFSNRVHFPGWTNAIRRTVESRGLVRHEGFQRNIDKILHGLTKSERKDITHALDKGRDLTGIMSKHGVDMGNVQTQLRQMSDDLWDEKVKLGLANPNEKADNYVFHYYRPKLNVGEKQIREYKASRKLGIKTNHLGPTLEDASHAGMNPYTDVGDVWKSMHADHQRKLSRVNYKTDIADEYGILSDNPAIMKAGGMIDVTDKLPSNIQMVARSQNKRYYLQDTIAETFNKLDSMHSLGDNAELNRFMRVMDRTTNWWKATATIYNPGNWVNNSMGDVFMNYINGVVNPRWYKLSGRIVMGGKTGTTTAMKLGTHRVSEGELWELYQKYGGSAGFLRADVEETAVNVLPRARHMVHSGYQRREDFSRLANFAYSMQDEFKRIPASGKYRLLNNRIEEAAKRASQRTAKFNIDYSDFTPFEKNVMKKAVPFYSWVRKATPLMIESIATKPGRMTAAAKGQMALEKALGVEDMNGNDVHVPLWLRDAGFLRFTGGPNPTGIRNPLPTNILGDVFGGADFQEFLSGNLSRIHPFARIPAELATGKQFFSGNKVPENKLEYALNQLPVSQVLGAASGVALPGQKEWTPATQIGRLAGSKPITLTDEIQMGELRRQQDKLDADVSRINKEIYPFTTRKTADGKFAVSADIPDPKDPTKKIGQVKKFDTVQEAIKYAYELRKQYGGK